MSQSPAGPSTVPPSIPGCQAGAGLQSPEAFNWFDVRLCLQMVCTASEAWLGLASGKAHTNPTGQSLRAGAPDNEGLSRSPSHATPSLGPEHPRGLARGGNGDTLSF